MLIDDGFGSGDLGLTSEDMAAINEQSVEEYFDGPVNYEIGHHARQSVKQYALKWAKSRNPDYLNYSKDCTNFASQSLKAGGWSEVLGLK